MLSAYYSKGCHSEKLFAELKISQNEFFKVHLNKYNVIFLDIQWMYGNALEEMKRNSSMKVVSYIQEQVRSVFLRAVKNDGWDEVMKAISASEELLKATLAMDERTVAQMIQEVHMQNSSSLIYNNEISLRSVIALTYYSACRDYTLIREMPTGNGFADMVFLPRRTSLKPALVLELKWDKTAEGAIGQIKKKEYTSALKEYKGNILLVGISYEKKNKKHQCRIEKVET